MRVVKQYTNEAGDTIVEVIFAFAVFSLIAISTIVIMNQGIATAQRSLEVSQVRQQIDSQATVIRYIHEAHVIDVSQGTGTPSKWDEIIARSRVTASDFGSLASGSRCPAIPSGAFVINPESQDLITDANLVAVNASAAAVPPYAQVQYTQSSGKAYGIWVEAIVNAASTPAGQVQKVGYVDFHIRACWDSIGNNIPVTLGTIVRLYEPAF